MNFFVIANLKLRDRVGGLPRCGAARKSASTRVNALAGGPAACSAPYVDC